MTGGTRRQVTIVAALAVAVAAFVAVASERHSFFDLQVYSGALRYWVRDGGLIYDFILPGSRYGFTYPPFAALLMLPMAYVGWNMAIAISITLAALSTAAVLWWLVAPIARRHGWTPWFALAVALCLAAAFEPMRETVTFGQVNTLLLALVAADLLFLVARGSRYAGIGVGLATAIKLTPGVFILYLLVTGRWRAALVASGTATAATLVAAAVAPDASREFWAVALWNTDRVGSLSTVSNQSLQGVVARLDPAHPSTAAWLVLAVLTLAWWAWRVRAAAADPDREAVGLALTGVLGCLISPVTWVHHLVWLLPALILLADRALSASEPARRRLLILAAVLYALLCSRVVWFWEGGSSDVFGFLGENLYVWASLALLALLPVGAPAPALARGGPAPADRAA